MVAARVIAVAVGELGALVLREDGQAHELLLRHLGRRIDGDVAHGRGGHGLARGGGGDGSRGSGGGSFGRLRFGGLVFLIILRGTRTVALPWVIVCAERGTVCYRGVRLWWRQKVESCAGCR
jgi:hypothetical protein